MDTCDRCGKKGKFLWSHVAVTFCDDCLDAGSKDPIIGKKMVDIAQKKNDAFSEQMMAAISAMGKTTGEMFERRIIETLQEYDSSGQNKKGV